MSDETSRESDLPETADETSDLIEAFFPSSSPIIDLSNDDDASDDEFGENPDEMPGSMVQAGSATNADSSKTPPLESRGVLIRRYTQRIVDKYSSPALINSIKPELIESELIDDINTALSQENLTREKLEQHTMLKKLSSSQIAEILIGLYDVVTIAASGDSESREYDLVAMYKNNGHNKGTYVTSEEEIRFIARQYNYELTTLEFKEIIAFIRDSAPRLRRCEDRDLIAVNNGIFNFETKSLMSFDKKYVFLSKSHVDYKSDAESPTIFNPEDNTEWEVEQWMTTLSDDQEIVNLFWEIIGAIVRPRVRWGKAVFLYSESGNNGKGTLCELMRNICGSHATLSINDMNREFMLEGIVDKNAIITDENDVGTYIDRAANFKALITNDTVLINRKHKAAIKYQFFGLMVQCLNDQPKIKDKSESLYRRQIFIPMTKRFEGVERRYIKGEYLKRQDVLEYVLKRVLHMDYYELSEPEATKSALAEYKMTNDPIREFFDSYETRFVWDGVPFDFLYDAYRAWFSYNVPSGTAVGSRTFTRDLARIIETSSIWEIEADNRFYSKKEMIGPEPLIDELGLSNWINPDYSGKDIDKRCLPKLKDRYRGMVRSNNAIAQALANLNNSNTDSSASHEQISE